MENIWVIIVFIITVSDLYVIRAFNEYENAKATLGNLVNKPKVQVRSVFVSCQSDTDSAPDNEESRFEQHELFKHSALKNCLKKLTLTVKITSEADSSGDEYLPIEHVFEGPNQKRVRLLDPYILRLRREAPLQAYKLRKIEIVSGVLIDPPERRDRKIRGQSDLGPTKDREFESRKTDLSSKSYQLQPPILFTTETVNYSKKCEKSHTCRSHSKLSERYKRTNERNLEVESDIDDNTKWLLKEHFPRDRKKHRIDFDIDDNLIETDYKPKKSNNKKESLDNIYGNTRTSQRKHKGPARIATKAEIEKIQPGDRYEGPLYPPTQTTTSQEHRLGKSKESNKDSYPNEKTYEIYDIGPPQVWYNVHVQLFEKLSTPDGKTVWNDLTKGSVASVNTIAPEWTGPDLNVRYRSTKWIPREDFTLPSNRLCLLVPARQRTSESDANNTNDAIENAEYIVIPEDDILELTKEDNNIIKRYDNSTRGSESVNTVSNSDTVEQKPRRVGIRLTRSLLKDKEEHCPSIASQGVESYLTLRHKRPYNVQIDLEARADENQLVHVGSSGRISMAVADSTRRTRTILNLQIGNTGLAAANFRVVARDFDPLLSDLIRDKKATIAGPILIPPRHTRSVHLELPVELPVDVAHCTVTLLNDQDESVAVRDVAIKKGDRCFCVWHCDCVCLSDDPRLLCRDMDEAGMKAAGLTSIDRPRRTRSICCINVVPLNVFVIFIGVVVTLLLLGLLKATVGLFFRVIGTWGLPQLLQTPRKIEKYYESSLKDKPVEYDKDNWPIHPETKKRTVRVVSLPMEFILNVIFFVTAPCIVLYEAVKSLLGKSESEKDKSEKEPEQQPPQERENKDVYSTNDMQALLPRRYRLRDGLRRWMTPQAHKLSTELWKNTDGLQPLLPAGRSRASNQTVNELSADSEQDDTDYVLSQMQKSRESLARSQKQIIELDPSTLSETR